MPTSTTPAGRSIRAMREAQELRQRRLSGLAGVSHAYLSKVENGRQNPSAKSLGRITDALGWHLANDA